jgi:hypothetical protein
MTTHSEEYTMSALPSRPEMPGVANLSEHDLSRLSALLDDLSDTAAMALVATPDDVVACWYALFIAFAQDGVLIEWFVRSAGPTPDPDQFG